MKIELDVKEGRILEESRRALFLWSLKETEGDELRASWLLGTNIGTFRSNCAKYEFTHLIVSRKQGPPIDYEKHAQILKMSKQGLTPKRMAEHLGVSRQAVSRMIGNMVKAKYKREV